MRAARSTSWRLTSSAAAIAAWPVLKVTPLPPVLEVWPTESVSATSGRTSSTSRPRVSANCWATEVRVPPMSGEPSARCTVPSALTTATALEGPEPLPQ